MNLLMKVLVVAIIIIAVIAVVELAVRTAPRPLTESQAVANVTGYLKQSTPQGTMINITSVTPSQYSGSWHIVAGIVINGTSPCPSYSVESFDYPQYEFVNRSDNVYTSNCVISGLNKSYVIGSYPVAIARSYSLDIPAVMSFVNRYGYHNVVVEASHVALQNINNMNYSNVWVVYYTAPSANYSVQVYLQPNGTAITTT